jgi:type IV pilus assembly protein PilW
MNHTHRFFRGRLPVRPRERGLSLVELMVSLVIGLLILAALVALFVNTSRSNRELARTNGLIENGRLAMQLLTSDVQHAGFWGSYVPTFDNQTTSDIPTDEPTVVPNPCDAYATWNAAYVNALIGIPVQVYDTSLFCPAVVTNQLAGTDVLVVRHLEPCVAGEGGNCEGDDPNKLYFQSTLCATQTPPVYEFGTSGFTRTQRNCVTPAPKRKFVSNIYYIRDYAVTAGDGIPTLMRSQFDWDGTVLTQLPAVAMVEGIEGFRVELGVDDLSETGAAIDYDAAIDWTDPDFRTSPTNRGDGVPDGDFITCTTAVPCTADQLTNVTAVKVSMLVRSRDESPGYTDDKSYALADSVVAATGDHFKRHVFVSTMRLPNISGRRETP